VADQDLKDALISEKLKESINLKFFLYNIESF